MLTILAPPCLLLSGAGDTVQVREVSTKPTAVAVQIADQCTASNAVFRCEDMVTVEAAPQAVIAESSGVSLGMVAPLAPMPMGSSILRAGVTVWRTFKVQ